MLEVTPQILRSRSGWLYRGQARPDFAHDTSKLQESVWDYPRPPLLSPIGVNSSSRLMIGLSLTRVTQFECSRPEEHRRSTFLQRLSTPTSLFIGILKPFVNGKGLPIRQTGEVTWNIR